MVAEESGTSNVTYRKFGFPKPEFLKCSSNQEGFAVAVGWPALADASKHPDNLLQPPESPALAWGDAESSSEMYTGSFSGAGWLQPCCQCPAVIISAAELR